MSTDDETLSLSEGATSWREVDGETILLDLRSSDYLGVNASGTVLWRLLAEGTTRSAMVAALVDQFGVDLERATRDVDAFLVVARERCLLA